MTTGCFSPQNQILYVYKKPGRKRLTPTSAGTERADARSCPATLADKNEMKLERKHPLVGTWITDGEDSDVALVIKVVRGRFAVSGFCRSDGERFKVTKVCWDGDALSFDTLVPSTKCKARHILRLQADGKVEVEFTFWEVWKKKDAKPGELPEARTNREKTANKPTH